MVDKRLNTIKIDESGKWIMKLENVVNDINNFYSDFYSDDMINFNFADNFIQATIFDSNKDNQQLLLEEFALDVYSLVKFFPFLIVLENYELMEKIKKVIEYLLVEKIKQANYCEINVDEFCDLLIAQKNEIINSVLEFN